MAEREFSAPVLITSSKEQTFTTPAVIIPVLDATDRVLELRLTAETLIKLELEIL
jgi:hypothetical protein